jgi:hypothetical protein
MVEEMEMAEGVKCACEAAIVGFTRVLVAPM